MRAGLEKGVDDARAPHRRRRAPATPHCLALKPGTEARKMAHEADAVGVVGDQLALLEPQRVGGAHGARGRVLARGSGKRRLLVRHRDVAAGKARRACREGS